MSYLSHHLSDFCKRSIQQLQEGGTIIITVSELYRRLEVGYPETVFAEKLVDAYLSRLALEGVVRNLHFEQYLLLHPELFVEFATAIVYSANQNSGGLGAVNERALLSAALKLDTVAQLDAEVRNVIVQAVVKEFLERRICHKVETAENDYLIFPHRVPPRDSAESSVKSPWVREEAAQGLKQRKLVPIRIDEVEPPLGFGLVESVQLIGWNGRRDDLEFRKLLSSVSVHLGTHASLSNEVVLEIEPGEPAEPAAS